MGASKDNLEEKKWEKIKKELVLDNPWLKIYKIDFLLPNGEELKEYFVAQKRSVCVMVPINDKGEVYLIREYERGIDEYGYKLPSGRIDEGEEPLEAAKRELGEEVGVEGDFVELGKTSVDPGFMTTWAHFYGVTNIGENDKRVDNLTELFDGKWIPFERLGQMVKSNQIKNPFVISGYYFMDNFLNK